jgi:hypothetical protein
MKAALNHGGRSGVEWAEALVPSGGRIINRHEVALRQLLELEIGWHKTGHESRSPGRDDKTGGGRWSKAGEQRLRRSDRHQRRLGEKEGKRVLVIRSGQRNASVRDPAGGAEKRSRENAAVSGEMAAGHVREEMKGMAPGGPDPEGMKESK